MTTGEGKPLSAFFADAMGAEDSLIRHNFVSGNPHLTVALFGVLRPGDTVLCVTGTPYDTIQFAFGIKDAPGSLKEFGVKYEQIDLKDERPDLDAIKQGWKSSRSRWYTYSVQEAIRCALRFLFPTLKNRQSRSRGG